MEGNDNDTRDVFCPECNVLTDAEVVTSRVHTEPTRPASFHDAADIPRWVTIRILAECKRCGGPFLIEEVFYEIPGEVSAPQGERVLYPSPRGFTTEGLPLAVAEAYQESAQAFTVGLYPSCAIMSRKALEAVCSALGAQKGNLKTRIDRLRDDGLIDNRLSEWAHGLRLTANDAAHELDLRIDKDDARDTLEFLEAVLMYVFKLTKRFEEFQARMDARKKGESD